MGKTAKKKMYTKKSVYPGITPRIASAGVQEALKVLEGRWKLTILFELFPRKVSASGDEAPEIIRELQAFWQFLQREYRLENAAACLSVLDDRAARELQRKMSDPATFGIAKSFVMMGMQRGFDLSSEEGINEWMATYNAEIATGAAPRIPLPGERSEQAQQFRQRLQQPGTARNRRKKNRRRK